MAKTESGKSYEGMFLLPAGASAEMEKSLATVRGMIERHQGQILVLKKWDERKLAYELRGQKRGLYILAYFTAPGSAVTAIERDVNLSEDVLRVLITRSDHLNKEEMAKVEPQPIAPREERPSWERDDRRGGYGDRGPRRDDRDRPPRDDRPREDRPPRREEPAPAEAGAKD
jgi:small subunit ribosomal protein S6